ncbi:MAG TPA: DUF2171 domain-containing protein [Novosphingobium sp.]|nr:DUF2171 domain-containing protein [Novosphingobium sp.]
MKRDPRDPAHGGSSGVHESNDEALNDRARLGTMGAPHASGGARAAAFIRPGMTVIRSDGSVIGTVDRVDGGRVWLTGDANRDGIPEFLPVSLVDGVDDARVILSERGDASFGLGADP